MSYIDLTEYIVLIKIYDISWRDTEDAENWNFTALNRDLSNLQNSVMSGQILMQSPNLKIFEVSASVDLCNSEMPLIWNSAFCVSEPRGFELMTGALFRWLGRPDICVLRSHWAGAVQAYDKHCGAAEWKARWSHPLLPEQSRWGRPRRRPAACPHADCARAVQAPWPQSYLLRHANHLHPQPNWQGEPLTQALLYNLVICGCSEHLQNKPGASAINTKAIIILWIRYNTCVYQEDSILPNLGIK